MYRCLDNAWGSLLIDRYNGISYYRQLSSILIDQISNGTFQQGNRLPTENELSKRYGLNRHTVRRAMERLEDEGLIYKVRGKGVFVANTKIPYKVSKKTQFTNLMLSAGLTPDSELLDSYEITAGNEISGKLNICPSDKVIALDLLRYADEIPFCHTVSYFRADIFPGLLGLLNGLYSIYAILKKHYDIDMQRVSSNFEVSMPGDAEKEILQISAKIPLLVVKSISKSQHGDMVEYCKTCFRGDLSSITVDFNEDARGTEKIHAA